MSKIALSGPAGGTATYTVTAPTGATDRTLTLPDVTGTLVTNTSGSVSQTMLAANVAGNGPAFSAYSSSGTSCSSGVSTKILFQVENFDTNSNFASSRFTPTVAGYYQINAAVAIIAASGISFVAIHKNGAQFNIGTQFPNTAAGAQFTVSSLIYMNGTTDYLEIFFVQNSGGAVTTYTINNDNYTYFNGSMVRAA